MKDPHIEFALRWVVRFLLDPHDGRSARQGLVSLQPVIQNLTPSGSVVSLIPYLGKIKMT